MKNVLLDDAKFSDAAFQWKINVTDFSSLSDKIPVSGKYVSLHSNYMGNTKAKANLIKLCHAESVVLSSLMTHAFVQFY